MIGRPWNFERRRRFGPLPMTIWHGILLVGLAVALCRLDGS